jgi:ABC-type nitrate/sulfonate/bicarbonate transport system ATPase subunit
MVSAAAAKLEVRALAKTFELEGQAPLVTLDGVDLVAQPGEFVAVIGPSGCGKTTLFQILAGLERPDGGEVLIDGRRAASRLGTCAFMPQRDGLLPWRRTIDNVTIGLELAGLGRAAARERAGPLLERFGLGGFETAWPWQLSGGMRQRAAFLRTVLLGKPAMLLDEPFGALDGITRSELQQWLLEVWSEVGSTVLLITHDVAEAVFLADRVYVMTPRPGRIAGVLEIELPRPRTLALAESPQFGAHEARLRELLRSQSAG